jgi:hypothetical protein
MAEAWMNWSFRAVGCGMWLGCDLLMRAVYILTILMIVIDHYAKIQNRKCALRYFRRWVLFLVIWLASFVLTLLVLLSSGMNNLYYFDWQIMSWRCDSLNLNAAIFAIVLPFYWLPLIITIVMYVLLIRISQKSNDDGTGYWKHSVQILTVSQDVSDSIINHVSVNDTCEPNFHHPEPIADKTEAEICKKNIGTGSEIASGDTSDNGAVNNSKLSAAWYAARPDISPINLMLPPLRNQQNFIVDHLPEVQGKRKTLKQLPMKINDGFFKGKSVSFELDNSDNVDTIILQKGEIKGNKNNKDIKVNNYVRGVKWEQNSMDWRYILDVRPRVSRIVQTHQVPDTSDFDDVSLNADDAGPVKVQSNTTSDSEDKGPEPSIRTANDSGIGEDALDFCPSTRDADLSRMGSSEFGSEISYERFKRDSDASKTSVHTEELNTNVPISHKLIVDPVKRETTFMRENTTFSRNLSTRGGTGLPKTPKTGRRVTNYVELYTLTKFLPILFVIYYVLWLPFILGSMVLSMSGSPMGTLGYSALQWVGFVNAAVHPLVFYLVQWKFRMTVKNIFKCE